jgi:hypothetical protein
VSEIRDLPCPGPQLFDYMRNQARQFNMSVFKMALADPVELVSTVWFGLVVISGADNHLPTLQMRVEFRIGE